MENAVRHGACLRVGATNDPRRRSLEYDREGYARCVMFFCRAANARMAEDHLLGVARMCGTGRHNVQNRSNYGNCFGFVYVIMVPPRPRLFGIF
jgi:RNA:NAD 2'-phosphotransferase (TPT1/KptA family)